MFGRVIKGLRWDGEEIVLDLGYCSACGRRLEVPVSKLGKEFRYVVKSSSFYVVTCQCGYSKHVRVFEVFEKIIIYVLRCYGFAVRKLRDHEVCTPIVKLIAERDNTKLVIAIIERWTSSENIDLAKQFVAKHNAKLIIVNCRQYVTDILSFLRRILDEIREVSSRD